MIERFLADLAAMDSNNFECKSISEIHIEDSAIIF
jgi:hypothetical protein